MAYAATENSFFLNLPRRAYGIYCFLEERVFFWYNQSCTRSVFCGITQKSAIALRFSVMGRLAGIKEKSAVLENSDLIRRATRLTLTCRDKTIAYFVRSRLAWFFVRVKENLSISVLNATGLIVVTAVLTDIILSFFLQKMISLSGWFVLGAFIFLGFWGLSCRAGWDEVKKTSVFLKWRNGGK